MMGSKYDYYTDADWEKEFEDCNNPESMENVRLKHQLCEAVQLLDNMISQPGVGGLVIDIGKLNNFFINARALLDDKK